MDKQRIDPKNHNIIDSYQAIYALVLISKNRSSFLKIEEYDETMPFMACILHSEINHLQEIVMRIITLRYLYGLLHIRYLYLALILAALNNFSSKSIAIALFHRDKRWKNY